MKRVLRLTMVTIGLLMVFLLLPGALHPTSARATPATGTWNLTGSLNVARPGSTAMRLSNGKVLVVGGQDSARTPLASAELYDPSTGKWSLTGSLNVARFGNTATLLTNGKVLVAAGQDSSNNYLTSAELYNPSTGKWSLTGSLNVARTHHSAVLLSNGKVLVAGGFAPGDYDIVSLASAELYDPSTGKWSLTGSLNVARFSHPAILLTNGKVLVAGGDDGAGYCCLASASRSRSQQASLATNQGFLSPSSPCFCTHSTASAELYDPTTGKWSLTGKMHNSRVAHTATRVFNGTVLVSGGLKCIDIYGTCYIVATAEVYNATTGTWSLTAKMHVARLGQTASSLGHGKVLIAGGSNNSGVLASAEVYDVTMGTWNLTGSMNTPRIGHTATGLPNGQILVAGGANSSGSLATAELYTR